MGYVLVCFGNYMDIVILSSSVARFIDEDGTCDNEDNTNNSNYPGMKFWTL